MFRDAKYMLDLHIAPLPGALHHLEHRLEQDLRRGPGQGRPPPRRRSRNACAPRRPRQDADSIKTMTARGLQVITLDPKAAAEFRAAANQLVATMRGTMVPADVFDMAVQERDAVPEGQRANSC